MIDNSFENPRAVLINLINAATYVQNNNPEQSIFKLLEKLSKETFNLKYDGVTFCQLTGNIIGQQQMMKLQVKDFKVNVLQQSLMDLIQEHCFVNGRFERCFSIINKIQFLLQIGQNPVFSDPIDLEITDDILIQVYGDQKFQQMMEEIEKFYQETYTIQQSIALSQPMKCPVTQKRIILLNDGINLQSIMYSLEGAIKMLNNEKEKLFEHQIQFLSKNSDQAEIGIHK